MNKPTSHDNSVEGIAEQPSPTPASPGLIAELEILPLVQPEHTIYKVHNRLRNINNEAYEPLLIAIGPYHNHKENPKGMKSLKLHCLNSFLEREVIDIHDCILVVERRESKARECYAESINLEQAEFIEMLVLDGCFIIEFALQYVLSGWTNANDPLFKMDWTTYSIRHDLLLFENQIPFFIISELFNLINGPNKDKDLTSLLLKVFECNYAPKLWPIHESSTDIKHLLELVQKSLVLAFDDQNSMEKTSTPTDQTESSHKCKLISSATRLAESVKHLLKLIHRRISTGKDSKEASIPMDQGDSSENCELLRERHDFISSATRLVESNVKFVKTEDVCLFRMNFKNGCMRLPRLTIEDNTESFFRNLIAYEQYFLDGKRHVTDYVTFMDCLIDTPKDVKLLVECGIIENWIGSEEAVVDMFNKLANGVMGMNNEFIYKLQFEEVNKHCSLPINAWMAMLKQNHLNSPWAIIPIIAAFVLLALTLVQTVFTIMK